MRFAIIHARAVSPDDGKCGEMRFIVTEHREPPRHYTGALPILPTANVGRTLIPHSAKPPSSLGRIPPSSVGIHHIQKKG